MRSIHLSVAIILILLFVAITAPVDAGADKSWNYTLLTEGSTWLNSYPNSINSSGRIIGYWDYFELNGAGNPDASTFKQRAVIWDDAEADPKDLTLPSGMQLSWAAAINSRVQI